MMGPTHREWGAVTGALLTAAAGNDPLNVAVCFGMGYACACLPDHIEEPLGLKHRGMSHSWELVACMMALAYWLPPIVDYAVWGFALAWLSHLTGDWLYGKAGWGRGAGIPMFLGRHHMGLGLLKVNGWSEPKVRWILRVLRWPTLIATVVWSTIQMSVI